ncbi:PhzF family phenazine biosynthesis protein [Colwelliaceae bacterium 6441]
MKLTIYQVDAFASQVFQGNPAAVCPLNEWLDDDLLQKIAEENNLSETAFFVARDKRVELRWFTPAKEVDLCGHATLAAAYVLYQHLDFLAPEVRFQTKSGELIVAKVDDGYRMDFPASPPEVISPPHALLTGLGKVKPQLVLAAFDYIVVVDSVKVLENISPDFSQWLMLDRRGVVVTAQGDDNDFVSRCFFPKLSVNEDPVTGSAHCQLAPFWGEKLQLTTLSAKQLSKRSGVITCQLIDDRVILIGQAIDYMSGEISF